MEGFSVNIASARNSQDGLEKLEETLRSASEDVRGIGQNLRFKIGKNMGISKRLADLSEQLEDESKSMRKMWTGLENIANQYVKTEKISSV